MISKLIEPLLAVVLTAAGAMSFAQSDVPRQGTDPIKAR